MSEFSGLVASDIIVTVTDSNNDSDNGSDMTVTIAITVADVKLVMR